MRRPEGRKSSTAKGPHLCCWPLLFSTSLLPFHITRMQICKASTSEKREPVEMVEGFKSWSSRCESDSNGPRLTEPCLKASLLSSYRREFSVICPVLNSRAAELCFSWKANKSMPPWTINYNCLLYKLHSVSHWHQGCSAFFSGCRPPLLTILTSLSPLWMVCHHIHVCLLYLRTQGSLRSGRGAISFLNTRGQWWQQTSPFRLLFSCAGHRRIDHILMKKQLKNEWNQP